MDDLRFISGASNNLIKIWDISQSTPLATLSGHTSIVHGLEVIDSKTIASCSADKTIRIWSLESLTSLSVINNAHGNTINDLKLLSDGSLASASADKLINIWNISNTVAPFQKKSLSGHSNTVTCLEKLGVDLLASGSADFSVKIWNFNTGVCLKTLTGHLAQVNALKLLNNGYLASGSADFTIRVWNTNTGVSLYSLLDLFNFILYGIKNLDLLGSDTLISGNTNGKVTFWSISTRAVTKRITAYNGLSVVALTNFTMPPSK